MANKGMAAHHRTKGQKEQWFTPRYILDALGRFDLDPCTSVLRPFNTARLHYEVEDVDGLRKRWTGRVWLNPPYGPPSTVRPWLEKMRDHGNGIVLIFARTETEMFHDLVWHGASALFFFKGRLKFWDESGKPPIKPKTGRTGNAGAPSVLIAYGERNASALRRSKLNGAFVEL